MPTAVDDLNERSSKGQVSAAISDCIATEMRNGKEQDQAIAMCHEMARRKGANVPQPKGGQ